MGTRAARAGVVAVLACTALAGCVSQLLPQPPAVPHSYDFGPLPESAPAPLPVPVRLASVDAPSWLSGFDLLYRRLHEQPGALRPYAQSQWIAPVPELLARRLGRRLAQAAPAERSGGLALALEILTFEQVFTAADEAHVSVRVRARLEGGAEPVRERELGATRASTPDAGGATRGLAAAVDELIEALLEWVRQQEL